MAYNIKNNNAQKIVIAPIRVANLSNHSIKMSFQVAVMNRLFVLKPNTPLF